MFPNGKVLKMIPFPVAHLNKDFSRLAEKTLFGGPSSVGSEKPHY